MALKPKTAPQPPAARPPPPKPPAAPPARPPAPAQARAPAPPTRAPVPPPAPARAPAAPPKAAAPPTRQGVVSNAPPPATKNVNAPQRSMPAQTQQQQTQVAEKALAKNLDTALPISSAPAWLINKMRAAGGPRGMEVVDKRDLILPRLVLAQDTHDEVKARQEIDTGDIFDNLSKMIYAKKGEALVIVPIVLAKSRINFPPIDSDDSIYCRSDDAITARPGGNGMDQGGNYTDDCDRCVRALFNEETGKPECTLFYNMIVMLPQFNYLTIVWSNKRTGVKPTRRFLSAAKQLGTDLWAQKYEIFAVQETHGKFTIQNFDFKPIGWVSQEEYQRAEMYYSSIEGKKWEPTEEELRKEVQTDDKIETAPPADEQFPIEEEGRFPTEEEVQQNAAEETAEVAQENPPEPGASDNEGW